MIWRNVLGFPIPVSINNKSQMSDWDFQLVLIFGKKPEHMDTESVNDFTLLADYTFKMGNLYG